METSPDLNVPELSYYNDVKLKILDFGCGVGINTYAWGIACPKWTVIGYDSSSKLAETVAYYTEKYQDLEPKNVIFYSDWNNIIRYQYDIIVCYNSLSSMDKEQAQQKLLDFQKITSKLIVVDQKNSKNRPYFDVWQLIYDSGYGEPNQFFDNNNTRIAYKKPSNPLAIHKGVYLR